MNGCTHSCSTKFHICSRSWAPLTTDVRSSSFSCSRRGKTRKYNPSQKRARTLAPMDCLSKASAKSARLEAVVNRPVACSSSTTSNSGFNVRRIVSRRSSRHRISHCTTFSLLETLTTDVQIRPCASRLP
eukprot:2353647-Amphidinium_carterae.1